MPGSSSVSLDRRTQLLEVTLSLVAAGGLGAVTHRSVESGAGVPHGTVTYWFGSREGLLDALVELLLGRCAAEVGTIAEQIATAYAAGGAPDLDAVADAVAAWIDDGREMHLARLELELAAARELRVRERMAGAALVFWRMCEPLAAAAGSPDPERDGRAMATMVDGLLLDRLAHPQPPQVLASAIRHLLGAWQAQERSGA